MDVLFVPLFVPHGLKRGCKIFEPKDMIELLATLEQKVGDLTEECIGKFARADSFALNSYIKKVITDKQK